MDPIDHLVPKEWHYLLQADTCECKHCGALMTIEERVSSISQLAQFGWGYFCKACWNAFGYDIFDTRTTNTFGERKDTYRRRNT